MVQFGLQGAKTGFDIAEAFAIGELGEGHGEKLVETGEGPDPVVPCIAANRFVEFVPGKEVQDLSEDDSS